MTLTSVAAKHMFLSFCAVRLIHGSVPNESSPAYSAPHYCSRGLRMQTRAFLRSPCKSSEQISNPNEMTAYVGCCDPKHVFMKRKEKETKEIYRSTALKLGMASNNMRPLQFLGSLYLNDTHKIHTLGPPHIAQRHA